MLFRSNLGFVMVVNIILNIIFINKLGIIGAALASSLSTIVLFFLNLAYVWPVVQIKLIELRPLLYSLIMAAMMWLSIIYLKTIIWWPLTIISGAGLYILLMFLFRIVTIKELKFLKNSLFSKSNSE